MQKSLEFIEGSILLYRQETAKLISLKLVNSIANTETKFGDQTNRNGRDYLCLIPEWIIIAKLLIVVPFLLA